MDNDYLIIGRPMMAEIVGVTTGGLQKMEQRGFPVWAKNGLQIAYHLPTVVRWLKMDWERQHRASTADDPTDALSIRRKTADTRKAEIEVAQLESSLLDVNLIQRGLDGLMINMRTNLLSLPGQIGRDIDDPAYRMRAVANAERCVRETLEILASYDPLIDPHTDAGGTSDDSTQDEPASHPSTRKTHHQPVGRTQAVSQPRRRRVRAVAQ